MFTEQNERPKALPGVGRFARSLADGKLWQRDEKKPDDSEKRAEKKPTRKNPQPNVQPARADPFTRLRAAGISAGEEKNANAAGDTVLRAKSDRRRRLKAENVTSSLLG